MPAVLRLTAVLFMVACACASDRASRGEQMIEQAKAVNDIRGLPSFEMKATVRLDNHGRPIDGTYSLLWNGADQWREEINLPGYSEIQVARKEVVSVKRTTDFTPWQINLLHSLLAYGQNLSLKENERVQGIRDRRIDGREASCVEIAGVQPTPRRVCVDPSSGALVRGLPFVDENPTALGAKLFPFSLKYVKREKTLAEVAVTQLTAAMQFPASAFEPPAGAVSMPNCNPGNVRSGQLIDRVNPSYPAADRAAHVQGTVELYAVIGTDGALHGLDVVSGVDQSIDHSALEAVRQWRYRPYMCNGLPVEVETTVQVSYSLAR
ncbi:MAG: energy transducer TonB [Candidatus Sulfotelmatobacter sp.]